MTFIAKKLIKPLFILLTLIAIAGILIQIFFPTLYFSSQEELKSAVERYSPYDPLIFIILQIVQVILTPISHYTVSILGGFLYGPLWGGVYNWLGRVIGHTIAYFLGRGPLQRLIKSTFDKDDFKAYQRFIQGTPKTYHIRLLIIFLMIYLPLFPDDEISYLVGLAGLNFKHYFAILLLGHLGGSFSLAYMGAGINTSDPWFWLLTILALMTAIGLIFFIRHLSSKENDK